jgi:hypothetical protein
MWPENIDSREFSRKFFGMNNLPDSAQKAKRLLAQPSCLTFCFYYSGLSVINLRLFSLCFHGDRSLGGLTSEFVGKFGEKSCM